MIFVILKKNLTQWRKQLGRKILLRKANEVDNQTIEEKKTKNKAPKKNVKNKNSNKKKNVLKEKSNSNDELIQYATKMLEKRKKEIKEYKNEEALEERLEKFTPEHND